ALFTELGILRIIGFTLRAFVCHSSHFAYVIIGYLFKGGVSIHKVNQGIDTGQRLAPDMRFLAQKGTYECYLAGNE
ncbi:MAG: hypothetical protein MUP98_02230, partial [Candidatus Aminicenantes bacterium]|nr:hypothetical protein [Candidatus Aminicenantes bacterium]